MQDNQQPGPLHPGRMMDDAKKGLNMGIFLTRALSAPVEVFLRKGFGCNYFGFPAMVGCFIVPLWTGFWPRSSPVPMLVFWAVYLVMQLNARLGTWGAADRGEIVHSRYNGWPRLSRIFKRSPENRIKCLYEPAMVLLAGLLFLRFSPPLGTYLIAAAFSLVFDHAVTEGVDRARAQELIDGLIEQQQLAARVRELTNRR